MATKQREFIVRIMASNSKLVNVRKNAILQGATKVTTSFAASNCMKAELEFKKKAQAKKFKEWLSSQRDCSEIGEEE